MSTIELLTAVTDLKEYQFTAISKSPNFASIAIGRLAINSLGKFLLSGA